MEEGVNLMERGVNLHGRRSELNGMWSELTWKEECRGLFPRYILWNTSMACCSLPFWKTTKTHVQYTVHVTLSTQQPPYLAGEKVKLSSYLPLYPTHRTAQSSLHFTPWKIVQSNTILTFMGSFQPCCN